MDFLDDLVDPSAALSGRIARLSLQLTGRMQQSQERHRDLFSNEVFAPVASRVSTALAASAPWCTADELSLTTIITLWLFALDWQIDHRAQTLDQVEDIKAGCQAIATGAAPAADASPLLRLLADIRVQLGTRPAFGSHQRVWEKEFAHVLDSMGRECAWKFEHRSLDLDDYLGNAGNLGSTLVAVTHWIGADDDGSLLCLQDLMSVSDLVQQALRLCNDLATYERDREWGDLNALMLADKATVTERLADLVGQCRDSFAALESRCERGVHYLRRQLGFSLAFYGGGHDYWGLSSGG